MSRSVKHGAYAHGTGAVMVLSEVLNNTILQATIKGEGQGESWPEQQRRALKRYFQSRSSETE